MATEALVVLVVGLMGTVVGSGVALYGFVRRVRRSLEETAAVLRRLEPRLERFQQDGAVRARELDRLAAAVQHRTSEQPPPDPRTGRGAPQGVHSAPLDSMMSKTAGPPRPARE